MLTDLLRLEMKFHVLFLAPDRFALDVYERLFREYGHSTLVESRPAEALRLLGDALIQKPFDLFFVDFSKYNIDKKEFIRQARNVDQKLVIGTLPLTILSDMHEILDGLARRQHDK